MWLSRKLSSHFWSSSPKIDDFCPKFHFFVTVILWQWLKLLQLMNLFIVMSFRSQTSGFHMFYGITGVKSGEKRPKLAVFGKKWPIFSVRKPRFWKKWPQCHWNLPTSCQNNDSWRKNLKILLLTPLAACYL